MTHAGQMLEDRRKSLHMTRIDLARLSGVATPTIEHYERSGPPASTLKLFQLCDVLQLNRYEFYKALLKDAGLKLKTYQKLKEEEELDKLDAFFKGHPELELIKPGEMEEE